jgi:hypothetical protein
MMPTQQHVVVSALLLVLFSRFGLLSGPLWAAVVRSRFHVRVVRLGLERIPEEDEEVDLAVGD